MSDEFKFDSNSGQINIAKDNAKINAEQNRDSKYNISGGISGSIGDNSTGTVIVGNSTQSNDLDKIKELILELNKNISKDITINDEYKGKMQKAINTTSKQIESNDKDTLEVCVDNLENINNGIGKGTEIFKKVVSLVGLIKKVFGI